MSLDQRLRQSSDEIHQAVAGRRGEPLITTARYRRFTRPAVVMAAAALVLVTVGVGNLVFRDVPADVPVGGAPTIAAVEDDFPHLVLDLQDTRPTSAYDITDDATGERVGTHIIYLQTLNGDNGTAGREILLRVQAEGQGYAQFTDLVALAESTDTVRAAGRDVTIHVIPDEAIEEGSYDLHVLHWVESPGIEAIIIPWGLNRVEALDLMDDLERIEPDVWVALTDELGNTESGVVTTTTLVAETSPLPRLLVDLPGWEMVRVDEGAVDLGEMTFSDGQQALDLHWRSADAHDGYVADRRASAEPPRQMTVNGQAAIQFQYVGTTDFTTLWLDGGHSFEARGEFPDRASYEAVVAALTSVDVATWLNAMPESVVRADDRASVMAAMLSDIPQPDRFDIAELAPATDVSDRYQLGARITGAVACQWIEQWLDARAVGDAAAEAEAVDAMGTARSWSILIEMTESGAYPEVLWEYADAMAGDGTVVGGMVLTVEESYQDALGCRTEN
jgi:hypothetical protein